jgi:glucose/arabinose dehydrogenase
MPPPRILGILLCLFAVVFVKNVSGQTYPTDFAQTPVVSGISQPTVMAFAPDGRIFVARQNGVLRVIKDGALLSTPFVTLTVNSTGERGLIGIALDPDFDTNHFIYVYYTVPGSPPHNRISRFLANGDVAEADSEVVVLELDALSGATNHNGGAMHFGKDGKLYVAIGENATPAHAQNLDTYHGKLLRINKDGGIPEGNPFTTGSEQRRRVWAYGLRNPYTFSIHPVTGRILLNDVGQGSWEEINDATVGGRNFGWPATEGMFNPATYPNYTLPIYAYGHGSGDGLGCAITGGTFFSPTQTNYPAQYAESYFFQDLCGNWINRLDLSGDDAVVSSFATSISGNGLSITTGPDGNLYYLSRSAGAVLRIVYNSTTAPYITRQPEDITVAEGQQAELSVTALGSTPLTYQWQKDGVDIPGATGPTFLIASAAPSDQGDFQVQVSNGFGSVTSDEVNLMVIDNQLPVVEITSPLPGTLYVAGSTLSFSGSATDAEDGPLPPTSLEWQINFHHGMHAHDQPPVVGVASGDFNIPNVGETDDNVWYRIMLSATDLDGLVGKDSVDIYPRKSTLSFVTTPPGLRVTLDGQPVVTPFSVVSVQGLLRMIGAPTPQEESGVSHLFDSWAHGGDLTQTITTPTDDITYTAQFSTVVGVEHQESQGLAIAPNPVHGGQVTIYLHAGEAQNISLRVIDMLARTIVFDERQIQQGDNKLLLSIPDVTPGVYVLVANGFGVCLSQRLLVSH